MISLSVLATLLGSSYALPQMTSTFVYTSLQVYGGGSADPVTYTMPINYISAYQGRGDLVPMAKQISGTETTSPYTATFTANASYSGATATATLTVGSTQFIAVATAAATGNNPSVVQTDSCIWGDALSTFIVPPFSAAVSDNGLQSLRVGPTPSSNSGSASAPTPTTQTITGYLANCVDAGVAVDGTVTQTVTSLYGDLAVAATHGLDGYFTYLPNVTLGGIIFLTSGTSAYASSISANPAPTD